MWEGNYSIGPGIAVEPPRARILARIFHTLSVGSGDPALGLDIFQLVWDGIGDWKGLIGEARKQPNHRLQLRRRQIHRGAGPKDDRLFGAKAWPALRTALGDLCWLLNRGYASRSALELVGNRYSLVSRQRMAVGRCACTDEAAAHRQQRQVRPERVRGQELWLDGYNVLSILESALAGGIILLGRDGCCRDIAGIHRRYRKVQETVPALRLVGELTREWGVTQCHWWLDQPVSNSGRLRALLLEAAVQSGWNWRVDLVPNPDRLLADSGEIVATSDSVILDHCQGWLNFTRLAIACRVPQARLVDLSLERVAPVPE